MCVCVCSNVAVNVVRRCRFGKSTLVSRTSTEEIPTAVDNPIKSEMFRYSDGEKPADRMTLKYSEINLSECPP